jgi:hypothetical protein
MLARLPPDFRRRGLLQVRDEAYLMGMAAEPEAGWQKLLPAPA